MNIAICSADKSKREILEKLLYSFMRQNGECDFFVQQFNDGTELLNSPQLFHLCCLYVKSEDEFQLGKTIKSIYPNCLLILITALKGHIDEAFNIGAFRFYKTPFNVLRFYQGLDAAQQKMRQMSVIFHDFQTNADIRVPIAEIIHIETVGRKTKVVSNRHVWYAKEHLADWQQKLSGMQFLYPHASYLVNMDYAIGHKRQELLLASRTENGIVGKGYTIPISAKHQKEMKKQFYKHIKRELP